MGLLDQSELEHKQMLEREQEVINRLNGTTHDPIYAAARALMSEIFAKTSKLTSKESDMAATVTLYCGSHSENLFVKSQ